MVTMVMLAMLVIAEQRVAHQLGLELLTARDIVEMLKEALADRINRRHQRRHSVIESRIRTQRKVAPSREGRNNCARQPEFVKIIGSVLLTFR